MLKRARSTAATGRATSINASVQSDLGIPEIPKINGELILQVFTHRSLRRASCPPEQYDDNERLSELGAKALEACVTHALFDRRPMLDSSEIVVSKLQRVELLPPYPDSLPRRGTSDTENRDSFGRNHREMGVDVQYEYESQMPSRCPPIAGYC